MFSARGRAHRQFADDPVAQQALTLAGELSDTIRRERATARLLAEYLASGMPDPRRSTAPAAGRRSNGVDLRCLTCDVTVAAPVDDVDGTVEQARGFFTEHDRCACEIDLTDPTVSGRRVGAREA